jgi:DNA-binding HxlR family transcriptional regulator
MVRNAEKPAKKKTARRRMTPNVGGFVESIVGCKWSLHVLEQIRAGNNRPGTLARSAPGLTAKVLNERLAKMVRFRILERVAYPEVPPRVEYRFTGFGRRFLTILDGVRQLEADVERGTVVWENDGGDVEPSAST